MANRLRINERCRRFYKANPTHQMIRAAKSNAKRKGLPFDLEPNSLEVPAVCPILGIEIKGAEGKPNDNSPSLDRIVPSLGYVKDNVRVISYRANRFKNDMTREEAQKIFEDACRYNY